MGDEKLLTPVLLRRLPNDAIKPSRHALDNEFS